MALNAANVSANEPMFHAVLYRDKLSTKPLHHDWTWTEFVDLLVHYAEVSPCTIADGPNKCIGKECQFKAFPKDAGPDSVMAWSPVEIDGLRVDENVRAITLLVLDFDHLTFDEARRVVAALAPYEHVRHTTHNHRDGDICFRAILLLSRKVDAHQWHRFLRAAVAYLRCSVAHVDKKGKSHAQPDPTCKNRSRYYFLPSHPQDAPFDAERVAGRILDVDEVLACESEIPHSTESERLLPPEAEWDLDGPDVIDAIDCIARYFPEGRRHELALALGGMLRAHGATKDDARYILREAFRAGGSQNPEARAATVEHTWSLPPDAAMTGFTRVAEIIGSDAAEELGDYLTDARNEACLRGLRPLAGAPETAGSTLALVPSVDLGTLRETLARLATQRVRSLDRSDQIRGCLLRRALAGSALAQPEGRGDLETVLEGEDHGVDYENALRIVLGILAFAWPPTTPWEAAYQVLRGSLTAMEAACGQSWTDRAAKIFQRAQRTRAVRQAEAEQRRVQDDGGSDGESSGGHGPTSGSPSLPPDGPNWRDSLVKGATGQVLNTPHNARITIRNHEDFRDIRWNEVTKRVEMSAGPLAHFSRFGTEHLVSAIQDRLSSHHGINVPHRDLGRRAYVVAREHSYDPLKDYLNGLQWDGVPRIDRWLVDYCGAIETDGNREFLRMVSRRWPIALVARGLMPGVKVDNVLVFKGRGGLGKSLVFEVLGGEWFCDSAINIGDKDSRMMAGRYWLCELAECVAFKRSDHDLLKNFFSSRIDRFRPPYATEIEEFPRRALFVGTINDDVFLTDETGNRKYWVVEVVHSTDGLAALRRDRDQLLAEAVTAFRAREKWHFDYSEIAISEREADKYLVESPARLKVQSWWNSLPPRQRPTAMTTLEVFELAFDAPAVRARMGDLQQIGYALKRMGFERRRDSTGKRPWRYHATQQLLDSEQTKRPGLFAIPGGKTDEPSREK